MDSCFDINLITLHTLSSIDGDQQYNMSHDCSRTPVSIFAETIIPEDKRKEHIHVYLMIEYKNGLLVNSTQTHPSSKVDIIELFQMINVDLSQVHLMYKMLSLLTILHLEKCVLSVFSFQRLICLNALYNTAVVKLSLVEN